MKISVNDAEIHYDLRGEGEPLLLLHGFTGAGDDWKHVFDLDDLARRYRLIIPDARGHGRSTNQSRTFSHRQCAQDLSALLKHLALSRVQAVGMSLGANTLLHLATRQPDCLAAMVLVSCTMYYPPQARAVMRQMTEDGRSPEEWRLMRSRHVHGDEQIRSLWRHAREFADDYDDMSFTPPHLATIKARTLIVYGDRDPLYPVEMAVEMYRAILRASLCVVPDGGHGPIFDGDAKMHFARTSLGFLSGAC